MKLPLLPTKEQWTNWSLPSKLTAIGTYIGVFSIIFAIVTWLTQNSETSLLTISGSVLLDDAPLAGAAIAVVGVSGKWATGENGDFNFEIPDRETDSLKLNVSQTDDFETLRLDTTLAKTNLRNLHLRLRTQENADHRRLCFGSRHRQADQRREDCFGASAGRGRNRCQRTF